MEVPELQGITAPVSAPVWTDVDYQGGSRNGRYEVRRWAR